MDASGIGSDPILEPRLERPSASAAEQRSGRFAELIGEVISEANRDAHGAEHHARELAAGRSGIVETVLALNKADLSLRFVTQMRNRLVEAYQEILRIQV